MAGLGNFVQKALYLGIGAASYAGEKASNTVKDLQGQAQKLVDELVERGELTADEAQQLFNNIVQRSQEDTGAPPPPPSPGPRRIEILDDTSSEAQSQEEEALRKQVDSLRQQLEDLKRKSG